MIRRRAIYRRVSTREQADQGISLDFQLHLCRQAAGSPDPEVFTDDGYSGTTLQRPALQELLSRLDEFETVYVYRLDRLSRSVRDWSNISHTMAEHGVGFVSVSERFDFSTAWGKAALVMLAAFAELFVDVLRENVRAAFAERARRGLHHGKCPLGFRRTGPREPLIPDEQWAPLVTSLFSRYAAGESLSAITHSLQSVPSARGGTWHVSIVRGILANPAYAGQIVHRGEVYEGLHEPLIERELWEQVQRRLRRLATVPASARQRTLCPVLRCGVCGGPVRIAVSTQRAGVYRSYTCDRQRRGVSDHPPLYVTVPKTDATIWEVVRQVLTEGDLRAAARMAASRQGRRREDGRARRMAAERDDLDRQLAYNLQAARAGAVPVEVLGEQNAPLLARREAILRELASLGERQETLAAVRLGRRELEALIAGGDVERQRDLLRSLFARIEIHRDRYVFVSHFADLAPLQVARPAYVRRGTRPNLLFM